MKLVWTLVAAGALAVWALPAGAAADDHRARMLEEFDADGDGQLSEEERSAARDAFRHRALERFDANGDGVIDMGDVTKIERIILGLD